MRKLIIGLLLVSWVTMTACESKPNLDNREEIVSLLLESASQNDFSQVEKLLEDMDENALNQMLDDVLERWHLYRYPQRGDRKLIRLLLQKGADPNAVDSAGDPIMFKVRVAEVLAVFGENKRTHFHVKSSDGGTLLLNAIGARNKEKVQYLLEQGVDPNEKGWTRDGEPLTPLHFAINFDDKLHIVKMLLDHPEIDLHPKNQLDMTPLELAQRQGMTEVIKMIEEKLDETS